MPRVLQGSVAGAGLAGKYSFACAVHGCGAFAVICLCIEVAMAPGRRLDYDKWLLAFDRYALAGAALKQFSFEAACLHKLRVSRIACNAVAKGKRPLLGVLFDEVAR